LVSIIILDVDKSRSECRFDTCFRGFMYFFVQGRSRSGCYKDFKTKMLFLSKEGKCKFCKANRFDNLIYRYCIASENSAKNNQCVEISQNFVN
jgi:hypothetical protein